VDKVREWRCRNGHCTSGLLVLVNPSMPAKSMKELITVAKAKAGHSVRIGEA
jgi:hypothetical protein